MKLNKNSLVYIGYSLILLKYIFSYSAYRLPDYMNLGLSLVAIICFTQKIMRSKYSQTEFCIIVVASIYAFYTIFRNGDDFILLLVLFLAALKGLQLEMLIKIYLIETIVCFLGFISCSLISRENIIMTAAYREENVFLSRYALGYSHPNSLQGAYLHIVAALVLTKWLEKHKIVKYVVLEVFNCFLFQLSNSRAGFLVITLILLLAYFKRSFLKLFNSKVFLDSIVALVLGVIAFTIFATYNLSRYPILYAINEMITNRFLHASRFTSVYPVTLFGVDISEMASVYTLDCGIISTLLSYGIVGMFLCISVYCIGLYALWKESAFTEMIIVFAFVVYSVVESVFINPFSNLAFLMCIFYMTNLKHNVYRPHKIYFYHN